MIGLSNLFFSVRFITCSCFFGSGGFWLFCLVIIFYSSPFFAFFRNADNFDTVVVTVLIFLCSA